MITDRTKRSPVASSQALESIMTLRLFLFALLTLALAWPAHASSLFTYQVVNQLCLKGRDRPGVEVEAFEDFKAIEVRLTRSDGKELRLGPRGMKAGTKYNFSFSQEDGEFNYEGVIVGTYPSDDSYDVPIAFSVFVGGNLDMQVPREQIDLDNDTLTMTLTRPAGRAEIEIYSVDGLLTSESYELNGEAAGTPITLEWFGYHGEVVKLIVRGYDRWGFYVQEDITPWSLEIPHEEVHFASGSHVIEDSEKPKLDKAYAEVMDVVDRYKHIVECKLFIAGYTDTVSDRGYNYGLSERRARSIAAYFRAQGFDLPIYYQGFGEDVLAVETDDGVDEIKNRRALYVLAAWPPVNQASFPRSNWRPL